MTSRDEARAKWIQHGMPGGEEGLQAYQDAVDGEGWSMPNFGEPAPKSNRTYSHGWPNFRTVIGMSPVILCMHRDLVEAGP